MTSSAEERRAKALELHLAGATFDAIAKAVGYAGRSGAYKAVQEALKERGEHKNPRPAETELARLDAMLTGLWPKARRGDVQAVDRVLKIEERRDQLLLRERHGAAAPPPEGGGKERTPLDEIAARRAEREAGGRSRKKKA